MVWIFVGYLLALVTLFFDLRILTFSLIALNLLFSFLMLLQYTTEIHLW